MKTIILEIRDRATFIPALAIQMRVGLGQGVDTWAAQQAQDYYLHGRCGYPRDNYAVMLTALDGGLRACSDPYDWGDRTWQNAHLWITEHFGELNDGDVVDVRVILGEAATPAISERFER